MASTYTGLGTELMTTGENAATWGTKTNTNLNIIEQISGGYIEKSIAGTAQTTTLSVSDGSTGAELSHRILKFTGTITGNQIVTIPLDVQQMYILVNGTSGAYTVQFKYASGSGSSLTFGTTDKGTKIVYATADDGTNPNLVDTGISTNNLTGTTGDITIDSPADIVFDADGADFKFKDGGTEVLRISNSSSDVVIKPTVDAKDIIFQQYDGTEVARVEDGAQFNVSASTASSSSTTGALITGGGLGVAADANIGDDLTLRSDSAVLGFGADNDTTLTHTDGTGLTLNSTNKLTFGDAATYVNQSSDGVMTVAGEATIDLTASTAVLVSNDLKLDSDNSVIAFGADSEITLTHVPDDGLILKHVGTGDGKEPSLTFQAGDNDIAVDDVLGSIFFQAPDEGAGTDAILVAAGIEAVSEGDFSSSNNATKLSFKTAASEAATEKMSLSSGGNLTVSGDITADNWKQEGTNFTGSLLIGHSTSGTLNAAQYNTGVGLAALDALTSGDSNTALGNGALGAQTTGDNNVAVGSNAMLVSANGQYNVALGHNSMLAATSGNNNVAIGENSLLRATSPGNNVAVGCGALLAALDSASGNVALGFQAGNNITTGDGNVVIGNGDVASATGDKQFKISDGGDGSVVWMTGDSSANLVFTADVTLGDDLVLDSDSCVLKFGDDQDTTLTHTDGTGLTLNSTNKICFNDTSQFIQGSSNAILALGATDEIDLTATAIDINGTCDVSGTLTNGSAAVKVVGTETIWVPANAMTPTTSNGCASIAAVETTSGRPDMYVLDFDKDSDEFAQFTVAFPKSWNAGTVTYQVFWSGLAATGGVSWSMDAVAFANNDSIDTAYGTAVVVDDTEQGAVEEVNVSAVSGALTIAGSPGDDELCYFRIARDVSDSNDDSGGDARLHGIKLFYTTDAKNDA